MAELDFTLTPQPALGGLDQAIGGNRILERSDLALVSVAVPSGGEAALAAALQAGWSLGMPEPTLSSVNGDIRAIQTAADQIMLLFPSGRADADTPIREKLGATGYLTDQTHGWVIIEIDGPDVHAALERLCPIDLHPDYFAQGASARTVMEHIGAIVIRTGPQSFLLLSASSSAQSFHHAIEQSFHYL